MIECCDSREHDLGRIMCDLGEAVVIVEKAIVETLNGDGGFSW